MPALSSARSFLFVPGDRPERFEKAVNSGAHAIIIDLEDAVAPQEKKLARTNILSYLETTKANNILVRINGADSPFYKDDLAVAEHPLLAGVILPKANKQNITNLNQSQEKPIWPLVETIQAVHELYEFTKIPNLARLLFGTIDFSLEMGLDMTHAVGCSMLDKVRFELICASRLANLPAPVDGVFPSLDNEAVLCKIAQHARASGMGGMMCIHPNQVATVNQTFAPNETEIEWAHAVLKASRTKKSSFRFQGQMIDKPVLERAKVILSDSTTRAG